MRIIEREGEERGEERRDGERGEERRRRDNGSCEALEKRLNKKEKRIEIR